MFYTHCLLGVDGVSFVLSFVQSSKWMRRAASGFPAKTSSIL